MNKASQNKLPANRYWIVEFGFRYSDDHQRRAIEHLGILAHEVVRLFCAAVCPGSVVIEPKSEPIRYICCKTRDHARKIVRTFGGRLVPNLPCDLVSPD